MTRLPLHAPVLLALLLSACQTAPPAGAPLPETSSLLGVDVLFPVPLGRDPTLARAYFVKGPVHAGQAALPELVPATFVKGSRAYLLDPEPGTYSLVAVVSDFAPLRSTEPIAGVTGTVQATQAGDAIVLPIELIQRTRTTIAPGALKFMGLLQLRPGDRIDENTVFLDPVQERLAERVRPGSTARAGLAARFAPAWTLDLELSSLDRGAARRGAFLRNAIDDLGSSPWAAVIPTPAAPARPAISRRTPPGHRPPPASLEVPMQNPTPVEPPRAEASAEIPPAPEAPARELPSEDAAPAPTPSEPRRAAVVLDVDPTFQPAPAPPPERRELSHVPADSPLAVLEFGMTHDEVRELLGEPDEKDRQLTLRGWLPFYTGSDAFRIEWLYEGKGSVVFSVGDGAVRVFDVVPEPSDDR